jgi:hypothetical protein
MTNKMILHTETEGDISVYVLNTSPKQLVILEAQQEGNAIPVFQTPLQHSEGIRCIKIFEKEIVVLGDVSIIINKINGHWSSDAGISHPRTPMVDMYGRGIHEGSVQPAQC